VSTPGTPEENYDTALDQSTDRATRERAIENLEAANECDMLVELVQTDGLERRYREQALSSLAQPSCRTTLETLVGETDLDESLAERAGSLLEETPEDAGAGPT
jgi:hypothetical protein